MKVALRVLWFLLCLAAASAARQSQWLAGWR
jgi:hypothetical protein